MKDTMTPSIKLLFLVIILLFPHQMTMQKKWISIPAPNEDASYEGHYDTLSQALIVGDNFAVPAPNDNEKKVDFYIVKCTAAIEEFHSDAEDDWGSIIGRGSYAIKGFYYCMINEKTYKLLDKKPEVFIYSHLVRAIKIPMIPHPSNSKLYTISLDVSESIYNSMPFELQQSVCLNFLSKLPF